MLKKKQKIVNKDISNGQSSLREHVLPLPPPPPPTCLCRIAQEKLVMVTESEWPNGEERYAV